jgi:hypothetical protein
MQNEEQEHRQQRLPSCGRFLSLRPLIEGVPVLLSQSQSLASAYESVWPTTENAWPFFHKNWVETLAKSSSYKLSALRCGKFEWPKPIIRESHWSNLDIAVWKTMAICEKIRIVVLTMPRCHAVVARSGELHCALNVVHEGYAGRYFECMRQSEVFIYDVIDWTRTAHYLLSLALLHSVPQETFCPLRTELRGTTIAIQIETLKSPSLMQRLTCNSTRMSCFAAKSKKQKYVYKPTASAT